MILVWKHEELAWYTPSLQNIEQGETFGDGDTIVFFRLNDKLRSTPSAQMQARIPSPLI
jgi:hypothetical protein